MQKYRLANTRIASSLICSHPVNRLGTGPRRLIVGQVRLSSSRSHRSLLSHLTHGLMWGTGIGISTVAVGIGAYYLSGWKEKVDTAHQALETVQKISQGSQSSSKKASDLLNLARGAVKTSVAAVIPFGSKLSDSLVDKAFDTVDEAIDAHGEEAKVIINEMVQDILAAIDSHKEWPTAAVAQVVMIVQRETVKLRELATKPETQEKIAIIKQAAVDKSQDGWQRVKGLASQENVERFKEYVGHENLEKASNVGQRIGQIIWKKGNGGESKDDESKS